MKPESRVIVFAGINFITVPAPVISHATVLAFQQAIVTNGLEFVKVENPKNSIVITRDAPSPLQITVNVLEPQVGQVLIVAPQPKGTQEIFIQEAEAVIRAFESVWPAQNRQIIKADATIRELYQTTSQHAFQELWEERLGQTPKALGAFGRPIRGGGLRFVLDPVQEEMPCQIEIKLESFLRDTTKVFVEIQFNWPVITQPGSPFGVREHLLQVTDFIEHQLNAYLTGETQNA